MLISSRNNPTVKQIRALRDRKERLRTGLFFVEGIRIVGEAAQMGSEIETVIVAPELLESPFAWDTVRALKNKGNTQLIEVSREVFESVSDKGGPQGIGAVIRQRWHTLDSLHHTASTQTPLIVALDSPQDPGNIGTILRTADSASAHGVVLLGPSADPYDPSAVRASMGALFAQPIARASVEEFAMWKERGAFKVVGTSDQASMDYRECPYTQPLVLLMGSERAGLSAGLTALCDWMVRIPMLGRSDSLNLAVATGIMLYAIHGRLHPIAKAF